MEKNTQDTEMLSDENIRRIFEGAADFVARDLCCNAGVVHTYYIDGLTSGGDIADFVFRPLVRNLSGNMEQAFHQAMDGRIYCASSAVCRDSEDAALKLVNGFCVVLFPGAGAVAYEVKTGVVRGPASPEVENTVKGPKDAFVETIRVNTSLIRRHLRTPNLRFWETTVGKRSITNVAVAWVEGITNPVLVDRMKKRLEGIDTDALITPSAVEEFVTGSRCTAFPLLQYTERTDKFCQGLLDGRVGLIVDGLPLAYLVPVDLGYLMESAEDQGRDYITASAVRILRYVSLVADLLLPALYIALVMHHPGLIPNALEIVIGNSQRPVPYSPAAEVLGLLIAFELLQESGVHLPRAIGQSVSVVGGIVVGSAAVEAGLISSAALIAVSITGICGFVLPNRDLAEAIRVWRFAIGLSAALAGLWGAGVVTLWLVLHLLRLQSLGVPYLYLNEYILRKRIKYKERCNRKPDSRNSETWK